MKKLLRKSIKYIILLIILVVAGFYGYSWYKGFPLISLKKAENTEGQVTYNYDDLPEDMKAAKDVQDRAIVTAVISGLRQDLPKEEFLMQEVVDETRLKGDQSFFSNVQNGDKILIYKEAKKVLIFRPASNTIINFGDLKQK